MKETAALDPMLAVTLENERLRRFEMRARGVLGNLVLAANEQKRIVGGTLDVCIKNAEALLHDLELSPRIFSKDRA